MDTEDNNVRQVVDQIAALMTAFSAALEGRAVEAHHDNPNDGNESDG